jgi:hypothetical protein
MINKILIKINNLIIYKIRTVKIFGYFKNQKIYNKNFMPNRISYGFNKTYLNIKMKSIHSKINIS